jgi:hypothetical protein
MNNTSTVGLDVAERAVELATQVLLRELLIELLAPATLNSPGAGPQI